MSVPTLSVGARLAENREDGRGMLIVARVSEQLGWARTPTGTVVWARFLDADPEADPPAP